MLRRGPGSEKRMKSFSDDSAAIIGLFAGRDRVVDFWRCAAALGIFNAVLRRSPSC
jgi:hypothetical protein